MKLKLSLLLVLIITYSWSQSGSTKTFTGNGVFLVPAGVSSVNVQAWGGGGSGGGASAAPLLLGRGAAGGGGGAYASNTILVTPGTTLNVVVASQTAGTSGAGITGGNSTITGFESSILAAGGSGGEANNAGGSPIGGSGGTIAASAGSTKFAGANGGSGNSWNLLGLLLSSGAGGGGGGSGGAGGTPVSGLILSNAPGNAGSPPGGAGSGAINSALGASQIGGAGAAGRIIISYSCTNFSLTSTAATSVCGSTGTTSTVTLTGSAASLPVGNYEVTYNRSNPSATALTANLTVSTAGTGTFTAGGLSTGGSSTITITKLSSESCSSAITANNSATVTVSPATIAGTVNGGITVCSGSTSGFLTLSGNTGSVVKWQSSVSPFSTWSDIANTTTTYTSGALTQTTQFRAVVQSGVCAAINSTATTVTVSPATIAGTVNGGITVCSGSTSGFLTLSGNTGSVVKWQSSVSPFSIWSDIANTTTTYTSGALTETTQFRAVVKSGACAAANSAATTVIVSPATVAGAVNGGITVCSGSTSGFLTLSGNTGSVVKWQSSVSPFSTWSDIANTTTTYTSGALTETTQFRAVVKSGACDAVNSAATTVTVSPATAGGTVSGGTTINSGDTSGLLTLSGHTGSVFNWQSSVSPFSIWSDIANTTTTYTSGTLTETTQFRAVVSGPCGTANSAATTVTVNPKPTIALASNTPDICSDVDGIGQSTTLSYSATTGNPITYSIVWNTSPSNSFAVVTDAALPASPITILVPGGTIGGTYTGTLTVKNANGTVSLASVFTLKVKQSDSIISNDIIDPISTSTSMQYATLAYSGIIGNPTGYSLIWDQSAMQSQIFDSYTFSPSGGVINNIKVLANVPAGTYTGTMNFYNNDGCYGAHHVSIVINNPGPTIALASAAETRCSTNDGSPSSTTLEYTGTTENPTTYSIVWDSSPENAFVAVTDAALPASPITIAIPAGVIPGTYTGTLTVKNANGAVSSPGSGFTVTINETPLITTTGAIDAVCSSTSSQNTTLAYSGVSGNPISYFIDWNGPANAASLADQPSTPFAFESWGGTINTIQISPNVPAGTYTGILYIFNGVCNQSQFVSLIINSSPSITIASATSPNICSDGEPGGTSLSYSATTENPVTYSIAWNSSPVNSFVTVTDEALEENSIHIEVPAGTPGGIYTGTLTVKNANGCVSTGYVFNLNIDNFPTITTDGIIASVTTSSSAQNTTLEYSAATDNPTKYYINWNSELIADQGNTPFIFVSGGGIINNIEIPANVPPGTYSGSLVYGNGACPGYQPVSITINSEELPSITLTSSAIKYCLDNYNNAHYKAVPYSATTGNPVTYSIVWDSSPTNSFTAVTDAALPANSIQVLIPLGTASDTYTGTLTVKNANGDISSPSIFTIKVGRYFTISTSGTIASVATSTNSQNATLSYSAVEGNISNYNIDWDATANAALLTDQGDTPFTSVSSGGTINTIEIPANVPAGTYNGTMYLFDGTCGVVQSVSIVINGLLPTIALTSSTDICLNNTTEEQYAKLDYKGTTGNPTTYSIVWNSSPGNNLIVVTDAILPASPISIAVPNDTLRGTYTGTLIVKDANGVNSLGKTFNLNVGVAPSITIFAPIRSVCSSTSFQNATLEYSEITGNPTSYYIDWDETANAALLQDQSITSYEFEGIGGLIESIGISANVPGGSYSGTMYLVEGACTGSVPVSIEINSTPAAPIIGEITPVTDESRSTVSVSGLPRRTEWTILISPSLQTRTGFGDSVLIYDIPVGTSTLTVSNFESTCASEPSASFVIVDERSSSRGVEAAEVSEDYTTSVTAFNQVINIETINHTISEVFIYDVSGNLLYKKDKISDSKLIINSLRSSNQVLVVKVVLNNNRVATKKVIY
ncbi:T9SS sorting signal type C domain-containing protein [[Flexibacter] sp. ATCC 35103]|uniref:beta strand repeat-containing protein n=1 Tax=[Flexibacter] sp. ATCC 35103 TaxID=1937528 RepID=UPI0009D3C3C5|nr:T9SS sorting signal type C domain-containing protein [[Flexibacter] sp. ATCC 35103]OMQ11259.1 hypothetical protein BXU01_13140 [[Flexibacter] sp. ATCC 35103]